MYCNYRGGLRPPYKYGTQNTQAPSEFLTTSIPKQKPWILLIFAKMKSSKLKVCRFLSSRPRPAPRSSAKATDLCLLEATALLRLLPVRGERKRKQRDLEAHKRGACGPPQKRGGACGKKKSGLGVRHTRAARRRGRRRPYARRARWRGGGRPARLSEEREEA